MQMQQFTTFQSVTVDSLPGFRLDEHLTQELRFRTGLINIKTSSTWTW
jgi:hypothetical protein